MRKASAGYVLVVTERSGPSFITFAVHVVLRQRTMIYRLMDNFIRHVLQGFLAVAAPAVGAAIEIALQRGSKFAVLAPRSTGTVAGLNFEIIGRRWIATRAAIDAKGIGVADGTVIVGGHRNFTRRTNVLQARRGIIRRIAIAHKLVIAVLVLSFNAHAAVSGGAKERKQSKRVVMSTMARERNAVRF